MKINCVKGFYKFYPESANDLTLFADIFGVELIKSGDYFTFGALASLDDYSIKNQNYGGIPAKINYAGTQSDVFASNGLKYDAENDLITTSDIIDTVGEHRSNYNWVVTGICPAFARLADNTLITGFDGYIDVINGFTVIYRWEYANI